MKVAFALGVLVGSLAYPLGQIVGMVLGHRAGTPARFDQ